LGGGTPRDKGLSTSVEAFFRSALFGGASSAVVHQVRSLLVKAFATVKVSCRVRRGYKLEPIFWHPIQFIPSKTRYLVEVDRRKEGLYVKVESHGGRARGKSCPSVSNG
jgi:hypothetical protein